MWTSGWRAKEGRGKAEKQGVRETVMFELTFEEGMRDLEKWRQRRGECQEKGRGRAEDRHRGIRALG